MKRIASAAAIAVGLHLLLFSLDAGRRDTGKRDLLQPDAVLIDLVAAPPQVERPSPPSSALPPTPLVPPESVAGDNEPVAATAPKTVAAPPGKVPRPLPKKSPAAPAPSLLEPKEPEMLPEDPWVESPVGEGRLVAGRPAGRRTPADEDPPGAHRQALASTLQAATPNYDRNPPPEYPRRARQLGFEGTVLLQVWVNPNGGVDHAKIAASSGYAMLDDSALRAVKGWRFTPARQGDQPVAALVQVPVRFTLTSSAAAAP